MTTFEELCHKVYCAANITNIIQGTSSRTPNQENRQQRTPPWRAQIERRITTLRKEIGVLHTYLVNRKLGKKVEKKVWAYARKLKIKKDREYHQHLRTQRYQENNLFKNNQRGFFRRLSGGHGNQQAASPDTHKMQQYWSDTWTQEGSHNTEATWIEAEKSVHLDLTEMTEITITEEDVKATVRRLKNWSAAGVDGIHNFWWKSLTATHKVLARLIKGAIKDPTTIPFYFTLGTTLMIPKKGDLTNPKNYRPITCLPAIYKILTSTIGHKINTHIKTNNIMSWEQNGCKSKARGSKELLVIDNTVTKQAKKRLKNISVAWIDYQKAFDSVPHSWLLEILKIYEVHPEVIQLLKCLMSTWRTSLTWRDKSTSYRTSEIR
ncbi:uncharacterized protein LOC123680845 [Harmonia axyridis]|uniref:uncharacterized protein LOC123680845 n=1 Tax=Harmonia axyridis TaxID=115357 RepID=UPI001E2790A7|nr:uncharacterized protein LOC123680845 [Harmonia axyridis]